MRISDWSSDVCSSDLFVSYATSKAALHGLTRALAIDLGPDIRVVCLAPAAVATPMLTAGFVGKEEAFAQLKQCHALERIATPDEIADTACFLLSGKIGRASCRERVCQYV